ncbi:hypothetical protein CPB86DRAFT_539676 [Serendipita vermifera]|nr:hypothetical protein CPB86DRAFT_539676 [Serendipita vermifera]
MIFEPIYTPGHTANDQQIAILFINMALCVLADPTRPMYHPDSHRYYHLSRVSMSLGEDLLHSHSLYAVQYLQLFSTFNLMIDDPNGPNRAWGALSLAVRLAQMAGLHRDNEQWDKYPEQAEHRRRIWWDLVSCETVFGFAMGRPRAIYPAYYDTKMPKDAEDEGECPSFSRLGYRWIADCLGSVLDEAFAVKPPAYATILKLDKTVRDWNLGNILPFNHIPKPESSGVDPKLVIRSLSTTGLREIALMYLHRRYFVEALTKRSNEPFRSKYSMSVLAVHRSATTLLQGILRSKCTAERIFATLSFIWVHALSAYLCLSAIVIKSPGCSLAQSSLIEIDRVKDALTTVKTYRVLHAKPIITKLHEQAHIAMNKYKEGKWSPDTSADEVDADVMKFIGRSDFTPAKPQEVTAKPTEGGNADESIGNGAHTVLFEYMKSFEGQPEKDLGAPSSTPHLISEQDVLPHGTSGPTNNIGTFESYVPDRSLGHADGMNGLGLGPESYYATGQAPNSTRWPTNSLYDDISLNLDSLLGQAPNSSSQQPFPFHDPLAQRPGPNQTNEQQLQDQVWEQFLSTLMPGEMPMDSSLR